MESKASDQNQMWTSGLTFATRKSTSEQVRLDLEVKASCQLSDARVVCLRQRYHAKG
jgi:hypothetical protein